MKLEQLKRTSNGVNTHREKQAESQARLECQRLQKLRRAIKAKKSTELNGAAVEHMAVMLQDIDSQLNILKARLKMPAKQESKNSRDPFCALNNVRLR